MSDELAAAIAISVSVLFVCVLELVRRCAAQWLRARAARRARRYWR